MIDVPELDIYLNSFFYFYNWQADFYSLVDYSDEIRSWFAYLQRNQSIFRRFIELVQRPDFGFTLRAGKARTMYGEREFRGVKTPYLNYPAQYLRIYARLLYKYGFLPAPTSFDSHKYFLLYMPKKLVYVYKRINGSQELQPFVTQHRINGSHSMQNKQHNIVYNVAVPLDLGVIVEEELHALGREIHGTTRKADIVKRITEENPNLVTEIESNLNLILSSEEKRFKEIGERLRIEESSELDKLRKFVNLFEDEVIASITPMTRAPT